MGTEDASDGLTANEDVLAIEDTVPVEDAGENPDKEELVQSDNQATEEVTTTDGASGGIDVVKDPVSVEGDAGKTGAEETVASEEQPADDQTPQETAVTEETKAEETKV